MKRIETNIRTSGLTFSLEAYRCHGEEKLKRPACLKGLKPVWSLPIIGKECKVFEPEDGSLVLHMGELFCRLASFPESEDMQLPFSALARKYPERFNRKSVKGFVYADAWCTIYERNEGYIRITGLCEALSDIFGLKLGPIYDAMYDGIRGLSLKDARFLPLGLTGAEGADSAAYRRLCENIVSHYFVLERDKNRRKS